MTDYLEEAAAELRKARASGDRFGGPELRAAHAERMSIVAAFTRLAAIERGLLPPEMAPGNDRDDDGLTA